MAAVLAHDPRPRFLFGDAGPDVHPGRTAPRLPSARKTPTFDPLADDGATGWRTLSRLGFSRRGPAGPMDSAILPPPCPCRLQSSGSNRRSGVAYGAFPVVLLAACCSPWRARRRKPRAIRHHLGTAETCHIVEVGSDW